MSALEALLDSQESQRESPRESADEENDQDAFNDAFHEEAFPQGDGLVGGDQVDVGSGNGGSGGGGLGDGGLGGGGSGDGGSGDGGLRDRDGPAEVQFIQVLTVQDETNDSRVDIRVKVLQELRKYITNPIIMTEVDKELASPQGQEKGTIFLYLYTTQQSQIGESIIFSSLDKLADLNSKLMHLFFKLI